MFEGFDLKQLPITQQTPYSGCLGSSFSYTINSMRHSYFSYIYQITLPSFQNLSSHLNCLQVSQQQIMLKLDHQCCKICCCLIQYYFSSTFSRGNNCRSLELVLFLRCLVNVDELCKEFLFLNWCKPEIARLYFTATQMNNDIIMINVKVRSFSANLVLFCLSQQYCHIPLEEPPQSSRHGWCDALCQVPLRSETLFWFCRQIFPLQNTLNINDWKHRITQITVLCKSTSNGTLTNTQHMHMSLVMSFPC